MNYYGLLIHTERLRRNWSQEGLCRGICAVSYLSKIEQGKVTPSEDIRRLLLERLGLSTDAETEIQAKAVIADAYETLFSGDFRAFRAMLPELQNALFQRTTVGLEFLLLQKVAQGDKQPLSAELESCMDARQLAIQRTLQSRHGEAVALYPNGYFYCCAGIAAYEQGNSSARALEYLQTGYDLAAREGAPYLMLNAQLFMGNCYCNQVDFENMTIHYKIAERLARALHDDNALRDIRYNTASVQIEAGAYTEAYAYFSNLKDATVMSLHKLAICCEKLGKTQQALDALDRAETMESEYPDVRLAREMCTIVRYRLEHRDYLTHPEYGKMLLSCFAELKKTLPVGYAAFHLPWVLEWYTATRQYRKAYELVANFPLKYPLTVL